MSPFSAPLLVAKLSPRRWQVCLSFSYQVSPGETIRVPAGYSTDFASIPRWLWSFLPSDDSYTQCAVLHDWLCSHEGDVERFYDSDTVHRIFHVAMLRSGVNQTTARLIYAAVRRFGPKWETRSRPALAVNMPGRNEA